MTFKQILYIVCLGLLVYSGDALKCLECDDVADPKLCTTVTECDADESCVTQKIKPLGNTGYRYKTGCMKNNMCSSFATLVGKRSNSKLSRTVDQLTVCMDCCQKDYCNIQGCGTHTEPVDQRGPYCLKCSGVSDPSYCRHVTLCELAEECVTTNPLQGSSLYEMGCISNLACGFISKFDGPYCDANCCSTDMCNGKCYSNRTATTQPVPFISTTLQTSSSIGTTLPPLVTTTVPPDSSVATTTEMSSTQITTTQILTTTNSPVQLTVTTSFQTAVTTSVTASCSSSSGYTEIQDSLGLTSLCIHIHNEFPVSWDKARDACILEGADLVVLDSFREVILMRDHLTDHTSFSYWMGLRDFNSTNQFRWVNGQPALPSASDWEAGQPNHYALNHDDQDCGSISGAPGSYHRWHDEKCGDHQFFICEK